MLRKESKRPRIPSNERFLWFLWIYRDLNPIVIGLPEGGMRLDADTAG
jgi:hypothetical protein